MDEHTGTAHRETRPCAGRVPPAFHAASARTGLSGKVSLTGDVKLHRCRDWRRFDDIRIGKYKWKPAQSLRLYMIVAWSSGKGGVWNW